MVRSADDKINSFVLCTEVYKDAYTGLFSISKTECQLANIVYDIIFLLAFSKGLSK